MEVNTAVSAVDPTDGVEVEIQAVAVVVYVREEGEWRKACVMTDPEMTIPAVAYLHQLEQERRENPSPLQTIASASRLFSSFTAVAAPFLLFPLIVYWV